ncbi:MAG: hypothetical protein AVDCRST_MAG93-5937 [uncultured Chloroflexia bacterium]|uniref:Uncharacterized protein n=1 Tax=uncultured Chloroflexia bacterium TaxID=1672391 RepID=A0A6J4L8U8_9CHLR|nr:MAG: hypothetical protein AVDCRST_MAG93-5937 [uncultured Chloroflexia bacterium]
MRIALWSLQDLGISHATAHFRQERPSSHHHRASAYRSG